MRPLTRSTPPAWSSPSSLAFTGNAATTIGKVFPSIQPSTAECLQLLEDHVTGRSLSTDELAAVAVIRARLAPEYKKASPALLTEFGGFCAYCELPLDDPVQLEHAVPKNPYPTFALSWENFLPACIGCNSRKGDKPSRAAVAARLPPAPPPMATDFHDAIRRDRYRWPDLDDVAGYFTVRLHYEHRDAATGVPSWRLVANGDSVDAGTKQRGRMNVVEGTVRADIANLKLHNMPVAAIVCDATGGDARTAAMIAMCKLDRWPAAEDASDRRTLFRTEAWLRAVTFLGPVKTSSRARLPDEIIELIAVGGFSWVWLTVAGLISLPLRRLVEDALLSFPGTDPTRIS
jgi:uncharacterized protein (TIGR02646 family)